MKSNVAYIHRKQLASCSSTPINTYQSHKMQQCAHKVLESCSVVFENMMATVGAGMYICFLMWTRLSLENEIYYWPAHKNNVVLNYA